MGYVVEAPASALSKVCSCYERAEISYVAPDIGCEGSTVDDVEALKGATSGEMRGSITCASLFSAILKRAKVNKCVL